MTAFVSSEFIAGINAIFDWSSFSDVSLSFWSLFGKFQWTARTSGVLLVAGVGSYCAYRLCRRYLGKNFVWTLLDSAKCDLLARADSRLLHPAGEGYYDPRGSNEFHHNLLRDILRDTLPTSQASSLSGAEHHGRTAVAYTVVSSNGKVVRVIRGDPLKRSLRSPDTEQGFATLPQPGTSSPSSYARRRDSDALSTSSVMTSVSRPRYRHRDRSATDNRPSEALDDTASLVGSECSASLRLVWDGDAMWDDEFAEGDFDQRSIAPSDISEMSAIKRLQEMFQSSDSDQPSTSAAMPYEGDAESVAGEDVAEILARCSMQNSAYLYQSVVVPIHDLAPSEVASVCSGISSRSNLSSLRSRLKGQSRGLWELTSHSPEKETAYASGERELTPTAGEHSSRRLLSTSNQGLRTPMTDSCISRSSLSSSDVDKSRSPSGKSNVRYSLGGMVDSAIVTDFVSSDDESASVHAGSAATSKPRGIRKSKDGVLRNAWLDRISEKPSPQHRAHSRVSRMSDRSCSVASEVSLEWCDHGFQDNPAEDEQQTPRVEEVPPRGTTNES